MGINVDLASIRYLVEVARAGSFIGGARRAHVSPPAISKAIRRLEEELGVDLFERTTRRVMLTPAGERVVEQCARILEDVASLESAVLGSSAPPGGSLRIGAMEVFSIEMLPHALTELVADHPDVIPHAFEMIPQRMNEQLLAGNIDVGFTIGATPVLGLDLRPLGTSPGVLVCGRGHPLYARGRINEGALGRHPSVVPRFFDAEGLPSLDQFPEARYARRIGATIELLEMAVALVLGGRFLGYFPEISVRSHLRSGRIKVLRGLTGGARFELHALVRSARAPKPAAAVLIDRVATLVAARTNEVRRTPRARRNRPTGA
jgi:LysR family hydrogen peroxide-inducible transcriptional activator